MIGGNINYMCQVQVILGVQKLLLILPCAINILATLYLCQSTVIY